MKHLKILGLMLYVFLCISLLAGCGNAGNSQPGHLETLANVSQEGIFAGGAGTESNPYLLPFVSCMREVDLYTLLVSNSNYLLITMLLAFNQTGYEQYASAITLLIIVIVLVVNGLSSKLTGASIAKGVDSGTPLGGR